VRDLSEFFRTIDRDGDGKLSKRELPERPDLFLALDLKGSGFVSLDDMKQARGEDLFDSARRTDDEFLVRYDLNGDGAVGRAEFAGPLSFFQRIDRNGDGRYDKADRAGIKEKPSPSPKAEKKWGRL
jgi:Ca2+-binding EF-hand superfamily protein